MKQYLGKIILGKSLIGQEMNNNKAIDVMKYIAAIMVICVHCAPITNIAYIDFFIEAILCRIAVPFFFIVSAYFIRLKWKEDKNYFKNYFHRIIPSYLKWSLIFIPFGLVYINQQFSVPLHLYPFALVYGVFYSGMYMHLWYIPALLLSLFIVVTLKKYFSYKILFIITGLLFLFGSLETYYGLLGNGIFKDFFDGLLKVIFTTRNGLFYAPIFVLIGFFICDYQKQLQSLLKYIPLLTILFTILFVIEGNLVYSTNWLDMNFLLMVVPLSFCFFLWILAVPYQPKYNTKPFRLHSNNYYFLHPLAIFLVQDLGRLLNLNLLVEGVFGFLLVVFVTHQLSSLISQKFTFVMLKRVLYYPNFLPTLLFTVTTLSFTISNLYIHQEFKEFLVLLYKSV